MFYHFINKRLFNNNNYYNSLGRNFLCFGEICCHLLGDTKRVFAAGVFITVHCRSASYRI